MRSMANNTPYNQVNCFSSFKMLYTICALRPVVIGEVHQVLPRYSVHGLSKPAAAE